MENKEEIKNKRDEFLVCRDEIGIDWRRVKIFKASSKFWKDWKKSSLLIKKNLKISKKNIPKRQEHLHQHMLSLESVRNSCQEPFCRVFFLLFPIKSLKTSSISCFNPSFSHHFTLYSAHTTCCQVCCVRKWEQFFYYYFFLCVANPSDNFSICSMWVSWECLNLAPGLISHFITDFLSCSRVLFKKL